MIVTTSQTVEGHTINEYLGIVAAAKVVSNFGLSVKKLEQFWGTGVNAVIEELKQQADHLGADAIIAISFQVSSDDNQVRGTGTAVKLDK